MSTSASSAQFGATWSLNKRKALAFWSVIAIGGLIPAMAEAANPPPAPPVKVEQAQPAPSANTVKFLSQSEALGAIPDLSIVVQDSNGSRTAILTGLYPPACAGTFTIASTATDSTMRDKTGTQGFAIHDNGGFLSCIQKQNAKGNGCGNTANICNSLSDIAHSQGQADPSINIASKATVSLAYLDKQNNDKALGDNWSAADYSGLNSGSKDPTLTSLSDDEIQAEKAEKAAQAQARHEAALQAAILKCAQSPDGINDARESLANSGLDQSTIDDLTTKIDEYQARFDKQDLQALQKKVQLAVQQGKTDQFDDLEDQIYDYYNAHSSENPKVGDQLAQMVYDMAHTRADNANSDADVDKAEATLTRALDADSGLNLNDKNQQAFQTALNVKIPEARLGVAYQACDEGTANTQFQESQAQSNPMMQMNAMATYNAINNSAKGALAACQKANKLYDTDIKNLNTQLKNSHCSATASSSAAPMSLFGNQPSSSHDSSNSDQCQALSQESQQMQTVISQVATSTQQEAQQEEQSFAQQQNPLAALGIGRAPNAQQMPSSMPMISGGTFPGAPLTPQFTNPLMGSSMYGSSMYGSPMGYGSGQPVMIPTSGSPQASVMPGAIPGYYGGTPYTGGAYYGGASGGGVMIP